MNSGSVTLGSARFWVVSFLLPVLSRIQILAWPASVSGLWSLPLCGGRQSGGWFVVPTFFHIQLFKSLEQRQEGTSKLLPHPDHTGTLEALGTKNLGFRWIKVRYNTGRDSWGGVVFGGFYLRPRHEVLICSRGHYYDRLFTITDRLGLLKDLCYSFSWNV